MTIIIDMRHLLLLSAVILLCAVPLSAQDFKDFRMPERIVSPVQRGDTLILRLAGEYATEVKVECSWLSEPMLMNKIEGVWELKFVGIPPEMHSYRFIVDGVPALDPSNVLVERFGDELRNYTIVDGQVSRLFSEPRHRGNLSYVWYESDILGSSRRMAVYTPYGYEMRPDDEDTPKRNKKKNKDRKLYPVLYLLHDQGQDEESWLTMGRVVQILDNLIQQGRAVPMIVVMPNAGNAPMFMSSFINEIIPYVESHYDAIPDKAGRAACGIGAGGTTVINTAVMYPDLFDFLLPLSCGVKDNGHLVEDFLRIKYAKIKLFWTGCGTADREAYEDSRVLHDTLSYIHLDHSFYMITGGRDWRVWRFFFTTFTPMIFKYYTD